MKQISIPAPDFDLEKTLNSGQVFHWEKSGAGFVGMVGDLAVYVEQDGSVLKIRESETRSPAAGTPTLPETIGRYFALDHPLRKICASFPDDPVMDAARQFCRGLRIIRQPKWECLGTFICSSMKQVAHIRQISHALRERFGVSSSVNGSRVYLFPTAERLARCNEDELQQCGLGYRAKNLLASARQIASGAVDLDAWSALADEELRKALMSLPGVGPKVANCAMLFAYERIAAFPIDVWIERVLRQTYFPRRRKVTSRAMAEFAANYFGPHGGYAQQYLFHHARTSRRAEIATTRATAPVSQARRRRRSR